MAITVNEFLKLKEKSMDLKSFLKWEEPVTTTGMSTSPQVYIAQKSNKNSGFGIRWVFNAAWIDAHLDEKTIKLMAPNKLNLAVSIDRKEKAVFVVFNPPADIPQYPIRQTYKKSTSIQLTNKVLLEDLWELLNFPAFVGKQFLNAEKFKEVDGKVVYKCTYNPKASDNMQIMAAAKKPNTTK